MNEDLHHKKLSSSSWNWEDSITKNLVPAIEFKLAAAQIELLTAQDHATQIEHVALELQVPITKSSPDALHQIERG